MNKLIKKAFTLIELLVVIAIIGILSGIIVVSMGGVADKANIAKSQIFSNSLRNSLMLNVVGEWKFDGPTADGSPVTVNDILDTWSSNNGSIGNAPTVKTGSNCSSGSCLQFDGINDYVDFGTNSSLSMRTGDATVSFWAKFDNAIATQIETLIVCGAGWTGADGYWIFRNNNSSQLFSYFSDGTPIAPLGNWLSGSGSLVANNWYNVVVVFTRNSTAQAYINGLKQTGYGVTISTQAADVSNSMPFRVGAFSSTEHRLAGKMDEIRMYNAAMPTSQIKEQYYVGLNKLLINGGIAREEYLSRMNNYAQN